MAEFKAGKYEVEIQRVKINRQGYASDGSYYGVTGQDVYRYDTYPFEYSLSGEIRADSMADAKRRIMNMAKFKNEIAAVSNPASRKLPIGKFVKAEAVRLNANGTVSVKVANPSFSIPKKKRPPSKRLCNVCGQRITIVGETKDGRLIGSCGDAQRPPARKRKNAEGYVTGGKFHPIRGGDDYDPDLAGDRGNLDEFGYVVKKRAKRKVATKKRNPLPSTVPPLAKWHTFYNNGKTDYQFKVGKTADYTITAEFYGNGKFKGSYRVGTFAVGGHGHQTIGHVNRASQGVTLARAHYARHKNDENFVRYQS